jgi:thioester reductase-like protein
MTRANGSTDGVGYLINGLPSLLARRVLEQVLCFEPRARVFAIVHADDLEHTERLLTHLETSQRTRVELLCGDLTAIDFGLSGSEYLSLAARIQRVHHVVASGVVYADASNHFEVGAALGREIIEFARAASGLGTLVIYSSAGVSGNRTGTVLEQELVAGQTFAKPMDQALALMELMVRRSRREIPVVVLRPTLLAADSQTGECERTSPLYRLVDAILSLPKAQSIRVPRNSSPLHLVAVDYVARAAYYVGRKSPNAAEFEAAPPAFGQACPTLHLADSHPTSISYVLNLLLDSCGQRKRGAAVGSINQTLQEPFSEWGRAVAQLSHPNVFYDTRQASSILGASGIVCPPFVEYADKLVNFVRGKRP